MRGIGSAGRWLIALGALNGALVVALGAYGAHALPEAAAVRFQTAVQYHMLHTLGLVAIGLAASFGGRVVWLLCAAAAMLLGIVLFCGSLYVTAATQNSSLVAFAPFGGASFILAWILFAVGAWRR